MKEVCLVPFFHTSSYFLVNIFFICYKMSGKRYGHVCFSRIKPPMKMHFWNIRSFEQLERNLILLLDEKLMMVKELQVLKDLFHTSLLWMTMMISNVRGVS